MSTAHWRSLTAALSALALGLVLTPAARPGDPLEDAKQRRAIAAQQVESDVRDIVRAANQLARTDAAKAAVKLREVLTLLADDTALSEERRDTLRATARARIRDLEADAARRASGAADDASRAARRASRAADDDPRLTRGLQDVQSLRNAGKAAEANQLQSDLARRYPDSPAATASRIIGQRSDSVSGGKRTREDTGRAFTGVMEEVGKSSVPESGDYVLPPDWKTRVAKRGTGPKLTEEEKATLKALATPIKVDLKDASLSSVIDYLQQATGVNIVSDKKTLESVGVTYETQVNARLSRATLRTVLKKVLSDVGLTYVIKDGQIQVVTPEEARSSMTVRTYYVGDLATVVDVTIPPVLRDIQMRAIIGMIIDNITSSIEPNTWESKGARDGGTIAYDPISMSLVIKQTAEVHYMLGGTGR